jgi:hypothetical protein
MKTEVALSLISDKALCTGTPTAMMPASSPGKVPESLGLAVQAGQFLGGVSRITVTMHAAVSKKTG